MTYPYDKADKDDVVEFTEQLHEGADFEVVRQVLRTQNLDPQRVILTTFLESDEDIDGCNEFAVVIDEDGVVYEYRRDADRGQLNLDSLQFWTVDDLDELTDRWPMVVAGLALYAERQSTTV